jgi:hypothetical protein
MTLLFPSEIVLKFTEGEKGTKRLIECLVVSIFVKIFSKSFLISWETSGAQGSNNAKGILRAGVEIPTFLISLHQCIPFTILLL